MSAAHASAAIAGVAATALSVLPKLPRATCELELQASGGISGYSQADTAITMTGAMNCRQKTMSLSSICSSTKPTKHMAAMFGMLLKQLGIRPVQALGFKHPKCHAAIEVQL